MTYQNQTETHETRYGKVRTSKNKTKTYNEIHLGTQGLESRKKMVA